jgi:hypothetical protein
MHVKRENNGQADLQSNLSIRLQKGVLRVNGTSYHKTTPLIHDRYYIFEGKGCVVGIGQDV